MVEFGEERVSPISLLIYLLSDNVTQMLSKLSV